MTTRPPEPDQPMPSVPIVESGHVFRRSDGVCIGCKHVAGAPNTPTMCPTPPADVDREPARPQAPELQGIDLPAPTDAEGRQQTLDEIRAELPDGAGVQTIDIAIRNLSAAPNKTLAGIAKYAFEAGARMARNEQTGEHEQLYVHHDLVEPYADGIVRIALLYASEPMRPELVAQIEAEQAAMRESVQTRGRIDALLGGRRKKGKRR